jgi:hypothetical protein
MIIAELDPAPGSHAQCVWFDDDDRRQQGWFEISWLRALDGGKHDDDDEEEEEEEEEEESEGEEEAEG